MKDTSVNSTNLSQFLNTHYGFPIDLRMEGYGA